MNRILLIDGAAGIYVPMRFYENFDFAAWGLKSDDYRDLSHPENEHYWDAWDDLLRDAKHLDENGVEWTLEQDDDLFAVSDDAETDGSES